MQREKGAVGDLSGKPVVWSLGSKEKKRNQRGGGEQYARSYYNNILLIDHKSDHWV